MIRSFTIKTVTCCSSDRNKTVQEFSPATIAKRHEDCVLETEDGIILLIYGSLSLSRMRANGYSSEVSTSYFVVLVSCTS